MVKENPCKIWVSEGLKKKIKKRAYEEDKSMLEVSKELERLMDEGEKSSLGKYRRYKFEM